MLQAAIESRPDMPTARTTKTDRRIAAVERACRYIEARIDGMEGDGASDDQGSSPWPSSAPIAA
jgi:hypothetical protein